MNRTTSLRSEEARRQAQSASLRAKQAQSEMLKERAAAMAAEAQKIGNLRALRLAKEAQSKEAAEAAASVASEAKLLEAKAVRSRRRADKATARSAAGQDAEPEMASADDMGRQS